MYYQLILAKVNVHNVYNWLLLTKVNDEHSILLILILATLNVTHSILSIDTCNVKC